MIAGVVGRAALLLGLLGLLACHHRIEAPPMAVAPPGSSPDAVEAWERLNEIRAQGGLAPVALDLELSAACRKHAEYLALNRNSEKVRGLSAHDEDPSLPGYTPEGARAGGMSDIHWGATPGEAVDGWLATLYHRLPLLRPNLERVGFGSHERISVLAFAQTQQPWGDWPVAYPFPDQQDVPLPFSLIGETPDPRPAGFPERTGYPITLSFANGASLEVTRALLREEGGAPVEHTLSSPRAPAISFPQSAVCLLPRRPLRPGTVHQVEIEGRVGGEERRWSWSFRTLDAVEVGPEGLESFAAIEGRYARVQGRVTTVCECNLGKWDVYVDLPGGARIIAQVKKDELARLREAGLPELLELETQLVEVEGLVRVVGKPDFGWILLDEPWQLKVLEEQVPFADADDPAALEAGVGKVRRWRGVLGRSFTVRVLEAPYLRLNAGSPMVVASLWKEAARSIVERHGELEKLEGRSFEIRGVLQKDWPFIGSWAIQVRHPSRFLLGPPLEPRRRELAAVEEQLP